MRANGVDQPLRRSLEEATLRCGSPLVRWQLQGNQGLNSWYFLAWDCGCAASYANDAINDIEIDPQLEFCHRHSANPISAASGSYGERLQPLDRKARKKVREKRSTPGLACS